MDKISNIVNNSFLLLYISKFFKFLRLKYRESFCHRFLSKISKKFMELVASSKIWTLFYQDSSLDKLYRESGLVRILNFIFNLPLVIGARIYGRFEAVFKSSLVCRFIRFLEDRIISLLGMTIVFTMIIPDHRWYNVYSVILVFLLTLVFIFKGSRREEVRFRFEELDLAVLVFALMIVLSGLLSFFPRESLPSLVYYIISFMALLVLVNSIESKEDLEKLMNYIALGLMLTALYGVYEWKVVGIEINPSQTDTTINQGFSGRVSSTMGNPNLFGELLVLFMPLLLVGLINKKSYVKKAAYMGAFLFSLVLLLKTGSRSAWVAFAGAMGVFVFLWKKKLIGPLIVLGVLLLPFIPQSIYKRFLTIFNPNDSSIKYRKLILAPALIMLRYYWFTGVGLGTENFNIIYKNYKPAELETVAHTHKFFLQLWLESGLFALLSILCLGLSLIRKTVNIRNKMEDKEVSLMAIGSLSGIGGLMVMGFADHVWFYNRILFLSWISIAMVLGAVKLARQEA